MRKYSLIPINLWTNIKARFKKLNGKGLPSNHTSRRNDSIIAQQLELTFEDYPPIARIDVGYNMDATGTQYDLLKVICRKNNDILWDLYFNDIDEGENKNSNIIEDTPIVPTTPTRITINNELKKAK